MWVSTTSLFHYPPLLAQLDSLSKEKALLDANVISLSVRGGGGGGTFHVRNSCFAKHFVLKGGGGTPITDKIRKVVFDVAPQVVFKVKGGRPLPNWMFFTHRVKGGGESNPC